MEEQVLCDESGSAVVVVTEMAVVTKDKLRKLERIAELARNYCDKNATKFHPILREMEQLGLDLIRLDGR
jgi:hypothetical protein